MPVRQRVLLLAGSVCLATVMGLAASLQPDARGLGTHQQLGLPPCSMRVLWDVRCPSCGMTTAWANVYRGQMGAALQANVGGTLLAIVAGLAVPWLGGSAWLGRWWLAPPQREVIAWLCVLFLAVALLDWILKLR